MNMPVRTRETRYRRTVSDRYAEAAKPGSTAASKAAAAPATAAAAPAKRTRSKPAA